LISARIGVSTTRCQHELVSAPLGVSTNWCQHELVSARTGVSTRWWRDSMAELPNTTGIHPGSPQTTFFEYFPSPPPTSKAPQYSCPHCFRRLKARESPRGSTSQGARAAPLKELARYLSKELARHLSKELARHLSRSSRGTSQRARAAPLKSARAAPLKGARSSRGAWKCMKGLSGGYRGGYRQ
jgi:hypothetical protein